MTDKSPNEQRFDMRPVPDPTVLTTEALQREIAALKEFLVSKIDAAEAHNAIRFAGIDREFVAIEAWRKEQKLDTKTAVDAALQAAEKAVREQTVASEKAITKSETSATEQSKQQYATFTASLNGVSNTLADVKERVGKIEATRLGVIEQRIDTRQGNSAVVAVIGAVVGVSGLIIVIVTLLITNGN